ncbi:hypothetical protein F5I97DRAFT_1935422 [Phlebopus sp. FC_14]|nr:hypothetical protein F5I97DRAFT_1935422 [Phlebopus sp. FC_14]
MQSRDSASHTPWVQLFVRAQGLQYLRAEKSWRPIVTVVVNEHQRHEVQLGCDGQNPNLKRSMLLHEVDLFSLVDISVHHRPSSKKKKKRNLIATACHPLHDLSRLQGSEKSFEIKLTCTTRHQRGTNKERNPSACLIAKLHPPEARPMTPPLIPVDSDGTNCLTDGNTSLFTSITTNSLADEYSSPVSPSASESSIEPIPPWANEEGQFEPNVRIRRGYWSSSDRALSDDELDPLLKCGSREPPSISSQSESKDSVPARRSNSVLWFAASMLPSYTEAIAVEQHTSTLDHFVDSFSPYRQLREARVDSDYERVLVKLQAEWTTVGASPCITHFLCRLDAAVFGFSSGSLFTVDSVAKRAIAIGSIASGIGLSIDAWFLMVYNGADAAKFQTRARDVYGKYFFFCISARLPALCMFTSACALMTFLLSVAWSAWPTAVLVMSFVAGTVLSLQFIIYGLHCVISFIADLFGATRRGILRSIAWIRRPTPSEK